MMPKLDGFEVTRATPGRRGDEADADHPAHRARPGRGRPGAASTRAPTTTSASRSARRSSARASRRSSAGGEPRRRSWSPSSWSWPLAVVLLVLVGSPLLRLARAPDGGWRRWPNACGPPRSSSSRTGRHRPRCAAPRPRCSPSSSARYARRPRRADASGSPPTSSAPARSTSSCTSCAPPGVEARRGRLRARRHGLAPGRPRPLLEALDDRERRRARGRVPKPRPHRAGRRSSRSSTAGVERRVPRDVAMLALLDVGPSAVPRLLELHAARRGPACALGRQLVGLSRGGRGRRRLPARPPGHGRRGAGRDVRRARTARRRRRRGTRSSGARGSRALCARGVGPGPRPDRRPSPRALLRVARTDQFEPAAPQPRRPPRSTPDVTGPRRPDAGRSISTKPRTWPRCSRASRPPVRVHHRRLFYFAAAGTRCTCSSRSWRGG